MSHGRSVHTVGDITTLVNSPHGWLAQAHGVMLGITVFRTTL